VKEALSAPAEQRHTAYVCHTPKEALNLAAGALECGLSIPRDMSIITFGKTPPLLGRFQFAHAVIPGDELTRAGAQMLEQKIETGAEKMPSRRVDVHRVESGNTLAAPCR
jgi:DNA-binding LacI/PurR family transcriptional regulator